MDTDKPLTILLLSTILLILFFIYYEEKSNTDFCDNKYCNELIIMNKKDDYNSLDFNNCINNNIIVQRRIRRELNDGKREKNNIMKKIINRKKNKEIKFVNDMLMESKEELKNVISAGIMDIKFKIKNDLIPKNLESEIKYVNKLIKIIEDDRNNKVSLYLVNVDDFNTLSDYLSFLILLKTNS